VSVQVVGAVSGLRQALSPIRRRGMIIGLAPTMGALHAGHARLIETARAECGAVVVSIFVNPIQFNDPRDFQLYPRDLAADVKICDALGADIVFAPPVEEMYPGPQMSFVEVTRLTEHLCGRFRPGHFRGVATVVLKLLNIVQPDRAYFGEKDAQQLAVIRRMVRDLAVPVTIIGVPTVREPDGLALSSRNQRLSPEERRIAPALYQALLLVRRRIAGGARDPDRIKQEAREVLAGQPGMSVEYLEIVDPETMQPAGRIEGPVLAAAAVWLGATRLIDNMQCSPGETCEDALSFKP
jgi:pantoate--beta-alanine ligase